MLELWCRDVESVMADEDTHLYEQNGMNVNEPFVTDDALGYNSRVMLDLVSFSS